MRTITVAVLAGGQSRRMGRDKAEIVWRGETLLTRTARVAMETGCSVLVIGRQRPDVWGMDTVQFLADAFPHQGPLGGLATALHAATGGVLLLACDMPHLTRMSLDWLLRQEPGKHGVAVCHNDRWEPLFSRYTPEVLTHLQEQREAGKRSLQSLIDTGDFHGVVAPPDIARTLLNVNTPDEMARLSAGIEA